MNLTNPDFVYTFFLDGNSIPNPSKWDSMKTIIKRDRELKGVFISMDGTLTFEDAGYDYLYSVYTNSGYCAEIEVYIEESRDGGSSFLPFYTGTIKISDVIFNKKRLTAKTKILDNSYFSKIYNNKSMEVSFVADQSKNGTLITPPIPNYVHMFEPQTTSYISGGSGDGTALMYKAYDLFKYMIAFMTDGEVEFDSTLFGSGGERNFTMVAFGKVVRKYQSGYLKSDFDVDIPRMSFATLFSELNKKLNLGLFIDNSGTVPLVRIEKWDDLFASNMSADIPYIDEITEQVSADDIYAILKIGSNTTLKSGALHYPEGIRWVGFLAETYNIVGKCNLDKVLDLTCDFIVSSNVIEQILINDTGDTSHDQDWFIIDSYYTGTQINAKSSNWLGATSYVWYNETFTNQNVALRYLKSVPNDIAAYLGAGDDKFKARNDVVVPTYRVGSGSTTSNVADFNKDYGTFGNDLNNRYGNGTGQGSDVPAGSSRYTIPFDGVYTFNARQGVQIRNTIQADYLLSYNFPVNASISVNQVIRNVARGWDIGYLVWDEGSFGHLYIKGTGNTSGNVAGDQLQVMAGVFNAQFLTIAPVSPTATLAQFRIVINRYNSSNVLQESRYGGWGNISGNGVYVNTVGGTFLAYQTDYIIVSVEVAPFHSWYYFDVEHMSALSGDYSTFECTQAGNGGGVYQSYDPSEYAILKDLFDIEFASDRFDSIKANPLSLIRFSREGGNYTKAWIDEITFDHIKQKCSFGLLSSKKSR